ncbi:MAG TPA: bifunctional diguanylate cyclase/phosphodiesterase [Polyangiaceae bacterium]|jgi:diguanylate cyclase (GGDEF)-like protein|nr:bifunctional diguanylate cyclase/phosphodiesterase [Polyangiaceae bacterium]
MNGTSLAVSEHAPKLTLQDELERAIASRALVTYFQPIVDLRAGMPLGYELLSRFVPPTLTIQQAFDVAEQGGMAWDLEYACRTTAIDAISTLSPELRGLRFFLNVSPQILSDPRFVAGFTSSLLQSHDIDQNRIVIEVTERESVRDYPQFERLIRHYVNQGFQIALDDFGSGHSSLVTLLSSTPHFLKLDREIVRDVHLDSYRQRLVRSLVDLAASIDTRLVAEGVELWEELQVLVRLGVRYAQGFLFEKPRPHPMPLEPALCQRIQALLQHEDSPRNELDETVGRMVSACRSVEARSLRCAELDNDYRHEPSLDEVVIVKEHTPVGLVTRSQFYGRTGGPVGYSLFSRRAIDEVAKIHFLRVAESTHVTTLARLATERLHDDLYDPVVVTNAAGRLLGTVTMKQLIVRSAELEIQNAAGANPLTGLPGNRAITRWLLELTEHGNFTVVYADLDRFKEFNDAYGFLCGDEFIRVAAHTLEVGTSRLGEDARLGHIGGDDFVIACRGAVPVELLQRICDDFDRNKMNMFNAADIERAAFRAVDRQGREVIVPLTTLSLAAIGGTLVGPGLHPALLSQIAASLKKKAKQETIVTGRSVVLFERRQQASVPAERLNAG